MTFSIFQTRTSKVYLYQVMQDFYPSAVCIHAMVSESKIKNNNKKNKNSSSNNNSNPGRGEDTDGHRAAKGRTCLEWV